MPAHEVVVIGASAGGIEALTDLAAHLPPDFPASVFVVVHLGPGSPGALPSMLARAGPLPAAAAIDGEPIEPGRIYVAPPDRHLLVMRGRARVMHGPRENRHRPAIDPLFRSAAAAYGSQVIGVVLTGLLDDGTSGLWAIKSAGGIAVVQDPEEAPFKGMPESALRYVQVDHCVKLRALGPLLARLVREPAPAGRPPARAGLETEFTMMQRGIDDMQGLGRPSAFSCPACSGPLWELQDGDVLRYRCHTGHAYAQESLDAAQADAVEAAMYSALRAMQEQAALSRRIAERSGERVPSLRTKHDAKARELESAARVLRGLLAPPPAGERPAAKGKRTRRRVNLTRRRRRDS